MRIAFLSPPFPQRASSAELYSVLMSLACGTAQLTVPWNPLAIRKLWRSRGDDAQVGSLALAELGGKELPK